MTRRMLVVLVITLALLCLVMPPGICSNTTAGQPGAPAGTGNLTLAGTPALTELGGGTSSPDTVVAGSNNLFSRDLYTQLACDPQNAGKDIFFSPFSISSALAITYEGARGTTADEIRSVFSFPTTSVMRPGYSVIDARITRKDSDYTLSTANALWVEKDAPLLPEYVSVADQWYSAKATNLDFANQPGASENTINQWVAGQTNNKIPELLPPDSITPITRLVITNAVYFKGTWQLQFDPAQTQDAPFTTGDGSIITVRMMQRMDKDAIYPYAENADLQMLSMPYTTPEGHEISMVVLLPRGNSLAAVEPYLDPANLSMLEKSAESQQVEVYFPKFTLATTYDLKQTLVSMGMPTAFSPDADFSGMDGKTDLNISFVIHKAYVNVNEEGTEAAAATAVGMMAGAAPNWHESPPPVFRADHPFIFLIQDDTSGAVLFIGSLNAPVSTDTGSSSVGLPDNLLVPGIAAALLLALAGLLVWLAWRLKKSRDTPGGDP